VASNQPEQKWKKDEENGWQLLVNGKLAAYLCFIGGHVERNDSYYYKLPGDKDLRACSHVTLDAAKREVISAIGGNQPEPELTADDVTQTPEDVLATHKFVLSPTRNPGWGEPDNHMVCVEKTGEERRETLAKYTAQQSRAYAKRLCEEARVPNDADDERQYWANCGWNAAIDHIEGKVRDG
jgi:hypothetical protein